MGKIFTFSSKVHGQCGTTASMVAAAFALSKEDKKTILVHTQGSFADLDNMFSERSSVSVDLLNDVGVTNLCYTVRARDLTKDDIDQSIIKVAEGIYLLPAGNKTEYDAERDELLAYIITAKLASYYDYVFVDIGAGKSRISTTICAAADINFVVISQNTASIPEKTRDKNTIYLCGNFDSNRKVNLGALRRKVKPVYAIPYCTAYADAIAEGRVGRFFDVNAIYLKGEHSKRGKWLHKPDEDVEAFITELLKLNKLGIV